jgi:phospholipase C
MNLKCLRVFASAATVLALAIGAPGSLWAQPPDSDDVQTTTPIKHVVVIFQENVSFDHYFATYPYATNPAGEPAFHANQSTPRTNNLLAAGLLDENPNSTQPFRLDRSEANTCDQNHNYLNEQEAVDHGLVDKYVSATGSGNSGLQTASTLWSGTGPAPTITVGSPLLPGQYNRSVVTGGNSTTGPFSFSGYCFDGGTGKTANKGIVMGYYDGNTVTAFWNYAQNFAMSDNSWSTTFGPSAPGAINLVAGTTAGATMLPKRPNGNNSSASGLIWGGQTAPAGSAFAGALIGDARPAYDDCVFSNGQLFNTNQASMSGTNVGDLMGDLVNEGKGITWGWFMGGFAPTTPYNPPSTPFAVCGSAGTGLYSFGGVPVPDNLSTVGDYIPHHQPFEFYTSTSNPHHLPPTSVSMIGKTDQANHQYDLLQFFVALKSGHLPAVSFLKAAAYQDGHPGYSDPLDEQTFVVNTINALMASDEWKETAVIIAYDDSDGWYDHTMDPVVNQSGVADDADDALSSQAPNPSAPPAFFGLCGTTPAAGPAANISGLCGYGQRQPLLVISPWARKNYVDHSISDQSSILRFIEDNFDLGRIGGASSDYKAGTLNNMFDFGDKDDNGQWSREKEEQHQRTLFLNPTTGEPVHF